MITPDDALPMRPRLFERWLRVWHALYISGLLIALGVALWETWGAWDWRDALLAAIVAVLIVAYLRVIAFAAHWPPPDRLFIAYYAATIALIGIAIWLNPVFIWVIGMLFGQMFGVLPPRLAVPGVLVVFVVILLASAGWQIPSGFGWGDAFSLAVQITTVLLLYLYFYHVFRTSQERGRLVAELRAAQAELEKVHAQERDLVALRERERMARDLHDGLGHSLAVLSVQLEAAQRLYPVDPDRASAQIDEMKRLTRDSMAELRRTLDALRAPSLGDEPFADAIQRLCAGFAARTGLDVALSLDPPDLAPPPALADTLWRVAQEALSNVERHAAACRVSLALHAAPDALTLTVRDDGRGLPSDAETRPGHYGIRGMRERVEGLGGVLSLQSESGVAVSVRLPLVGNNPSDVLTHPPATF